MLGWGFISVRGCLPSMLEIMGMNYSTARKKTLNCNIVPIS